MLKPKRSLGQNFLIDKNILNIITNFVKIADKNILEIGPGTGNLTRSLLEKNPKKIIVIEKDKELSVILNNIFKDKIIIINDDVLRVDEKKLCNEKLIVFGNLPYNISTEILCKWIMNFEKNYFWFDEMILMFQKEVAERILAKFNTPDYGRLSILSNWKLNIKKICDVSPNCFFPKPKIESSVLYFCPKKEYFKINNPKNLEKITRIFFHQRRKMIRKPFDEIFKMNLNISKKLNLNLNLRPQNLDLITYYKLTKEYENL